MVTTLVIDDNQTNREFLTTLLGYHGHRLLEANDGLEALDVARAAHPDLIISDILMPTMDGYEFVRQLRADPNLAHTPVIFSTAYYLDQEAKALAQQCGVPFVLPKPCEPETVLQTVDAALGLTPSPSTFPHDQVFDRNHRRLLINQLAERAVELEAVNQKLAALLELGHQLASEHDPGRLVNAYCRGAREIIGAKWAVLSTVNEDEVTGPQLFVNGLDRLAIESVIALKASQGILSPILGEQRPCRLKSSSGEPQVVGLPPQLPPVYSFLGVPIVRQARVHGWLCLVNKLGSDEFSDVDERLAVTLAAQVAVAHENARLFDSVRRHASELSREVVERRRAQEALQEQVQLVALSADVSLALTQSRSLPEMLHQCAESFVCHLEAAFTRIWTLNPQEGMLELRASAGMYTHLDGAHGRVPVGQFKIGWIAQECQPHLTNAVIGDPRVSDQEWARREGMVAFAGYPLLVGDRLVGVVAMFARHPLTEATIEAIGAVANTIALGIERMQTEEGLRRSEEHYRDLVEGSIQGITIQRNFKSCFVNRAYAEIFGYSPEEILAMDSTIGLVAQQEQARVHQYHEAHVLGGDAPQQYEFQGVRKDGSLIWAESLLRLVNWDGKPATQATIVDITARKQAEVEREQLQAQLLQAQKMEAIGTLAGGIAHDFNNILGTILGYIELALDDVPRESAVRGNLQEVLTAGRRARDLVRQILTFSRRSEEERQPIQLHLIIQEALGLMRASLPATIDMQQQLDATSSTVLADPTHLHQVLMNLCANAAHAMRETGGMLEVRVEAVEVAADFATAHPPLSPGPYVRLTVRDTGHGMERDILEHIFEPFFTTKPVGEGTGLGLAVVHGIISDHGGAIMVTSVAGLGATFDIYLPRFDDAAVESLPEIAAIGGNERILFVDDEPTLARWGEQALDRLGYDVMMCTSGTEALNIFQAAPQAFDLLITDQTMPGMTGEMLARQVACIRPDLPIILCTGFSSTMTREAAEAMGIRAYLIKPLMREDLALAIRQVLDRLKA